MADPEVAGMGAGQGEGQKASSASLLTQASEHLPGTLGSALVIIDHCLCRGLSGRNWIENWLRPVKERGAPVSSKKSFPLGIPASHIEVIFAIPLQGCDGKLSIMGPQALFSHLPLRDTGPSESSHPPKSRLPPAGQRYRNRPGPREVAD